MKSFQYSSFLASAIILASTASAQYAIDPNSVSQSTRQGWCSQQTAQCPLICLQTSADSATTDSNTCDPSSLTFACVCSNGLSPNISEYSQTLPYYICQEWGNQCVANCGSSDANCAEACRADHPCGALNPTRQNASTLTGTMTATTSGASVVATAASSTGSSADAAGATTDSQGQTIYTGLAGAKPTAMNGGGSGGQTGGAAGLVRVWALGAGQTFGSLALVGAFVGGFAVFL